MEKLLTIKDLAEWLQVSKSHDLSVDKGVYPAL